MNDGYLNLRKTHAVIISEMDLVDDERICFNNKRCCFKRNCCPCLVIFSIVVEIVGFVIIIISLAVGLYMYSWYLKYGDD